MLCSIIIVGGYVIRQTVFPRILLYLSATWISREAMLWDFVSRLTRIGISEKLAANRDTFLQHTLRYEDITQTFSKCLVKLGDGWLHGWRMCLSSISLVIHISDSFNRSCQYATFRVILLARLSFICKAVFLYIKWIVVFYLLNYRLLCHYLVGFLPAKRFMTLLLTMKMKRIAWLFIRCEFHIVGCFKLGVCMIWLYIQKVHFPI